MEWNYERVADVLVEAMSGGGAAESKISEAADLPNLGTAVLRVVCFWEGLEDEVRKRAAEFLVKHIESQWLGMADIEKEQVKSLILPALLSCPKIITPQLVEAISVIGSHTFFYESWPGFAEKLSTSLEEATCNSDYASIFAILRLLDSLCQKFTRYDHSDSMALHVVLSDSHYFISSILTQVLLTFQWTVNLIDVAGATLNLDDELRTIVLCQKLSCTLFYSLTFPSPTLLFDPASWDTVMSLFNKCLSLDYYSLLLQQGAHDTDDIAHLVDDGLRVAVLSVFDNHAHRMRLKETTHLDALLQAVWKFLAEHTTTTSSKLALACVKFLTNCDSDHPFFSRYGILEHLCSCIIPNLMLLRDEDQDLVHKDYTEFIRRGDAMQDSWELGDDTIRTISSKLLGKFAFRFKHKLCKIVPEKIDCLLATFAQNPPLYWRHKECAIFFVISLAKKKTRGGRLVVPADLLDVDNFFGSVVVPELQSQDVDAFPILKAAALTFFTLFMSQISKHLSLTVLPHVVRFLHSESKVLHPYAASCIEKLLLTKDDDGARGTARYTSADIAPYLPEMLRNLFNALNRPDPEESHQYVTKSITRLIRFGNITPDVVLSCINGLTCAFNRACNDPKNTVFNHDFSVAAVVFVRRACQKNRCLVLSTFEDSLFPILEFILTNQVTEFFPCAFYLLAHFVNLNSSPIPPHYIKLVPVVLLPELWVKPIYIPGLVRLLQAFLQKSALELNGEARLLQVTEILKNLIESKQTEDLGFCVLNTITEILEYDVIAPYLSGIWTSILWRFRNNITMRFDKCLVVFMSLFLVKHGTQKLVNLVDSVQPGKLTTILEQYWISGLKQITCSVEIKLASVSSFTLLCESPVLLDNAIDDKLRVKLLNSTLALISLWQLPQPDRVEEEPEGPEIGELDNYMATWEKEEDLFKKLAMQSNVLSAMIDVKC